ncbi:FAD-dependent oxidoreductase [Mangrovicoccus sp. HB161399]|uniref:flavin monoamine oxidase family protein n=1 Tax=Mangrovicoccus sp. HB161399 TaxID=2720392 RepID=UPI001555F489|nr:FAD-dependent oxidoreductase [Mangrovicoccus sp. HB161399]
MIGTAIVGGGLAGLALAAELADEGQEVLLFEARERLGGRVLTVADPGTGLALDMGPAWYWPDQPLMAALVAKLGLSAVPQHDGGSNLILRDAEGGPEPDGADPVHGGALRVAEGLGAAVAGLAARVGAERIRPGHVLASVTDCGGHVRLGFADGSEAEAQRVVLALPPRLIAETVRFEPEMPLERLAEMPTWMAPVAKAAVTWPGAPWRAEGQSGNATVTHDRAVLHETFDLSAPEGVPGALGGFLALDPGTRAQFGAGLPMLISSQMTQIFGKALEGGMPFFRDWAAEPFTCSARDLADPAARRSAAPAFLRRAHWQGRLYFAGTETAGRDPGHMEGALESAERVLRQIALAPPVRPAAEEEGLMGFAGWLEARETAAFDVYRHHLNQRLSRQQGTMVTRFAALDSVEAFFGEAIGVLSAVPFPEEEIGADGARAEVVKHVGTMAKSFLNRHLGEILAFNRSSCALRNFPAEHELPVDYVQAILGDVSRAGGGFLAEVDGLLRARAAAA